MRWTLLVAAIALSSAVAHADADDAAESDAIAPESEFAPAPAPPPAPVVRVVLPPIESRRIERVIYAIDGEEGEHAEVTVTRDGVVRSGRPRRGSGGGLPRLHPTVARLRNTNAFFNNLARLCAEAGFVDAPEDHRERFGLWQTLTVTWDGHTRTIAVGSAGLTRELVLHVIRGLGIATDGVRLP